MDAVDVTGVVAPGRRPGSLPGGWYPDPLAPAAEPERRRWWTGSGWSSRVRTEDRTSPEVVPRISWPPHAEVLVELPEGIAWIPWLDRLAPPPTPELPVAAWAGTPRLELLEAARLELFQLELDRITATGPVTTRLEQAAPEPQPQPQPQAPAAFAADPLVIAFGPSVTAPPVENAAVATKPATRPSRDRRYRRRVETLAFAAAVVLLVGGAIAGADIVGGGGDQPTVDQNLIYRDADAGFALTYPDQWRVVGTGHGTAIRFAIGAPGVPTTGTNTVSVSVGATASELPELHTLADRLTETLRTDFANVELVSASRTQVLGAPGFHFAFRDPDPSPPTSIEQYFGRTTAGRPLTITVTVREPRTAPSDATIRRFVASVLPA